MEGPLETAVPSSGILYVGRPRSREVIRGQQPVHDPSDPCPADSGVPKPGVSTVSLGSSGKAEGQGQGAGLSENPEMSGRAQATQ